ARHSAFPSSTDILVKAAAQSAGGNAGLANQGKRRRKSHASRRFRRRRRWRQRDRAGPGSLGGVLDALHVLVGKAKVVTDLVHQHMGDEIAKRFLMLGPVVEQGAAIEPDLIGQLTRPGLAAGLGEPAALEQAKQ